jgi:hypothetical protein
MESRDPLLERVILNRCRVEKKMQVSCELPAKQLKMLLCSSSGVSFAYGASCEREGVGTRSEGGSSSSQGSQGQGGEVHVGRQAGRDGSSGSRQVRRSGQAELDRDSCWTHSLTGCLVRMFHHTTQIMDNVIMIHNLVCPLTAPCPNY